MPAYLGALDQGTTSTRFIIFDRSGRVVSQAQEEHEHLLGVSMSPRQPLG